MSIKNRGFLSLLCVITPLHAQEAVNTLDTVVVSATRFEQESIATPAAISVITAKQIEQSGAQNLADLLRGEAGIQVRDYYGDGSGGAVFDLRGFGATAVSNTMILIDGRRLNNASDTAAPDVSTLSLNNIKRIEVIQGSAGTLFGNQAVGGVVNIITRKPDEFLAKLDLTLGSGQSKTLTASVSERLDNGLGYHLSWTKRHSDNYRAHNEVKYGNFTTRFDYQYAHGELFAELNHTDEALETPGALFMDELRSDRRQSASDYAGDYSDTKTTLLRVGGSYNLDPVWAWKAEFGLRRVAHDFVTSFRGFTPPESRQRREVYTFTPRLIGYLPFGPDEIELTIGSDLEWSDYTLHSILGEQQIDQSLYAFYLQAVVPLSDRWSLTGGARWAEVGNRIADSFAFPGGVHLNDQVSVGAIGLSYRPSSAWRLFARVDQNFRFAKVDEHTDAGGSPSGLKSQTGTSYEIGAKWLGENSHAQFIVYQLDLKDEISYDTALFQNVNFEASRRKGAIFELTLQHSPKLSAGVNYHYVDAEVVSGSFRGRRTPLTAVHNARLWADYQPFSRLNFHGEVHHISDQVLGGDFGNLFPTLSGRTVVNVGAQYAFDHWSIEAKINNLFNRRYSDTGATGYDATFILRDAYFPAPERTFWLGASYRF